MNNFVVKINWFFVDIICLLQDKQGVPGGEETIKN